MELEEALVRITALEAEVSTLAADRDGLVTERDALVAELTGLSKGRSDSEAQLTEAAQRLDTVTADLATTRAAGLSYLRRALLAEHAGQCVPELVIGESEEALLASLEVAKGAYLRALDTARAAIVSQTVPAGAPSARSTGVGAGLSPLQLIESGLGIGSGR